MIELKSSEQLFFEILQVALNTRECLSHVPTNLEWEEFKKLLYKHALIGVGFYGIKKITALDKVYMPPKQMIAEIYSRNREYEQLHATQIKDIKRLTWLFNTEGYGSCLLKGAGLQHVYPEGMIRVSGDIDIWVAKGEKLESLNKRRKDIVKLCQKVIGQRAVFYHHTDLPIKGKDIEVHFTPSWMFAPWNNKRVQQFFEKEWGHRRHIDYGDVDINDNSQRQDGFYVPSVMMNVIFILLHIYRHVFAEGVGLRQIVDYYFVLKQGGYDKDIVQKELKNMGLLPFAGALMWVMQKVLAMPEDMMICAPDKRRGKLLLSEIMQAGNFGKYDERLTSLNRSNLFIRFSENIQRNMRLVRHYPSEALCSSLWKTWQKIWRKYNGY